MDLSKAFDVIPHTLFVATLNAYGCDENALKLMYSYLSNRKQRTKLGAAWSDWSDLSKGVPQGLVTGQVWQSYAYGSSGIEGPPGPSVLV